MAKCYHCRKSAKHDIRGIKCCAGCYIVALEHSADIVLLWPQPLPRAHRVIVSYLLGLSTLQQRSLLRSITSKGMLDK